VENLVVRYGQITAVDHASFAAPAGKVTVILGPNGAGKTSTIEVCEGFRRAASGHVSVLGLDPMAGHRELTERMGVMLQGGGVYPSARVRDVVSHFCALHDRGMDAGVLIERVGLSHRAGAVWRRLSGGEQQRVSLALALAARPDVAFLDEPTSGVDAEGRDAIRGIIRQLTDDGCTVVLASHELAEAERVADNVVLFRAGQVMDFRIDSGSFVGVDVQLSKTNAGSTEEIVERYAYIGSQPEGQVAKIKRSLLDMAEAAALRGAALGLLPVIPAIPHADRAFGLFAEAELLLHDPLNRLAHLLVRPLAVVLFLFGLTRGGIDLAAFAPTTLTVLAALWIGKPLGLLLGALSVAWLLRLPLPAGIRIRDLVLIAAISGMGFTAPLLTLDTALPGGAMTEAARLGLALSLLAWPAALLLARLTSR